MTVFLWIAAVAFVLIALGAFAIGVAAIVEIVREARR